MRHIIFAPHLDDEIIGCYSILDKADLIVFFHDDYRAEKVVDNPRYVYFDAWNQVVDADDVLYLPSHYDLHPLHRKVRRLGLRFSVKRYFYSVEMNTPWLDLEEDPEAKLSLFKQMYPEEVGTITKSDKYFLFKSIKTFDELIWATVRFEHVMLHHWPDAPKPVEFLRNEHRHKFHIQVSVQQFGDDRDLEYLMLSDVVQSYVKSVPWARHTSCEMMALAIKRKLEVDHPDRLVRVSVYEDGENGCDVE